MITRRSFLKAGGAALALGAWGRGLRAGDTAAKGTFLVVVNLIGGNDGLNTCAPLHLSPYHERRPGLALRDALPFQGGYGWHPALAKTAAAGDVHVVQSVGYPAPNLSHFASQDIQSFGVRESGAGDGRGWLGRFADLYCTDPLGVVAISVGRRPDFAAHERNPLVVGDVSNFRLEHDQRFVADHLDRVERARALLAARPHPAGPAGVASRAVADAYALVERVQDGIAHWSDPGLYPATGLGRRFRSIAQLEAGSFGTRVYYTALGGFDMHANQATRHVKLLAELDGALDGFRRDMQRTGRWRDCCVLVISEFGRRTDENGSGGTDHGHGNVFLVAGGGVRAGLTGALSEADLLGNHTPMHCDFREVYAHLLERHLDVDPAPVFPEAFGATGELALV